MLCQMARDACAITPIIRLYRFRALRQINDLVAPAGGKNYKENKKLPAINRFFDDWTGAV